MSTLSTHVLDTTTGNPAAGVQIRHEALSDTGWQLVSSAVTDADGRVPDLGPASRGTHRLIFDTGGHFARLGADCFYPEVAVTFDLADEQRHYHVPLLIGPFGYTTYRGS